MVKKPVITAEDMVPAAKEVFGDMLLPDDTIDPTTDEGAIVSIGVDKVNVLTGEVVAKDVVSDSPGWGTPDATNFISLKGSQYLPARRRIIWMRGKPVEHPDWSIMTYERELVPGEFDGRRVKGGYARFYCEIRNEMGRVIATGTKCEYSERFMDFAEKAETGAIARALAVAGYGTESALDIDEGVDQDRLADAPVDKGRPINITSSSVTGLKVGGRSENATAVQLQQISKLSRELGWTRPVLVDYMQGATGVAFPDMAPDEEVESRHIVKYLQGLTFEQAGTLIQSLNHASKQ